MIERVKMTKRDQLKTLTKETVRDLDSDELLGTYKRLMMIKGRIMLSKEESEATKLLEWEILRRMEHCGR